MIAEEIKEFNETCGTCGSSVGIHSGGPGGTSYYKVINKAGLLLVIDTLRKALEAECWCISEMTEKCDPCKVLEALSREEK